MRADRLLQILLLLQTRGRMTAAQLAEHTEVSVRTIQRDMDALSAAGVPVYAVRGGDGGWQLVDGFRTTLTGLTPNEALAVAVGRADTVLRDIGATDDTGGGDTAAGTGTGMAMLKVLASLPALAQEAAEHARQRVHVDLEPWAAAPPPTSLRTLYRAASTNTIARITYAGGRAFDIAPLGLVAKGVVWYLVAATARTAAGPGTRTGDVRTYRVSRIDEVTVTTTTFERPADFDLATHWRDVTTNVVRGFPSMSVTLRVDDTGLQRLRWSARDVSVHAGADTARHTVDADLETEGEALSIVLSLAGHAEVVRPRRLRARVASAAAGIAHDHAGTRTRSAP